MRTALELPKWPLIVYALGAVVERKGDTADLSAPFCFIHLKSARHDFIGANGD